MHHDFIYGRKQKIDHIHYSQQKCVLILLIYILITSLCNFE